MKRLLQNLRKKKQEAYKLAVNPSPDSTAGPFERMRPVCFFPRPAGAIPLLSRFIAFRLINLQQVVTLRQIP